MVVFQKLEGKTTTLKNWIIRMEGNSTKYSQKLCFDKFFALKEYNFPSGFLTNTILNFAQEWKLPNGSIYLFYDLFWFDVFLQFATKIYISSEEILNWQNYVLNVFFFRNFNFLKLKVKNGATEFFCSSFVINSFLCVVYG